MSQVLLAWRLDADCGPDLFKPAVLVCDYAPTALLTTRGLGLARINIGESFGVPPRTQPMPIYRPRRPEPPARVAQAEQHALNGANATLARLGLPPLRCPARCKGWHLSGRWWRARACSLTSSTALAISSRC